MKYRSDNWENPYRAELEDSRNKKQKLDEEERAQGRNPFWVYDTPMMQQMNASSKAFEAGADARLEALRNEQYGYHYDNVYGDLVVMDESIQGKSGWLVFIPDEEPE